MTNTSGSSHIQNKIGAGEDTSNSRDYQPVQIEFQDGHEHE